MHDKLVEILMVEDSPDDADLALLALRDHKLTNRIDVVRDGAEALEYLFCTGQYAHRDIEQPPRLILLDIKLPKVDGLQVLERLKTDERTRTIPVVILTSSSEEPDIERGYKLGANSYIVKPVDFDQFANAVRQVGYYWMLLNQPPI